MSKTNPEAPFAYEGLDRVIHEKARLGILTSLIAHPRGLAFADLKQLCGLTDGNLSRHLQVLQESALVEVDKRGRTRHVRLRAEQMKDAYDWLNGYSQFWHEQFDALARHLAKSGKDGGRE